MLCLSKINIEAMKTVSLSRSKKAPRASLSPSDPKKASGSTQTRPAPTRPASGATKGFRAVWAAADETELKSLAGLLPVDKIAEKMHRTRKGIQRKAAKMNLSLAVKSGPVASEGGAAAPNALRTETSSPRRYGWADEAINLLKERAGKEHVKDIAKALGRSISSLQSKAQQLGLSLAFRAPRKVRPSGKAHSRGNANATPTPSLQPSAPAPVPTSSFEPLPKNVALVGHIISTERSRAGIPSNFEKDYSDAQAFLAKAIAR
jgi:hypothetical protein